MSREKSILEPIFAHFSAPDCTVGTGAKPFEIVSKRVARRELFPNELENAKSERVYYQIFLHALNPLPRPIVSLRLRRIVFICTTYFKLPTAAEINDLYDDSPLEDALWTELKRLNLLAERQYDISASGSRYFLDFALFCAAGKIDIETDGDRWHNDPARVPEDNRRNNALATAGWKVLRFNTQQIREEIAEYCVPRIAETVNQLGGLEGQEDAPLLCHRRRHRSAIIPVRGNHRLQNRTARKAGVGGGPAGNGSGGRFALNQAFSSPQNTVQCNLRQRFAQGEERHGLQ